MERLSQASGRDWGSLALLSGIVSPLLFVVLVVVGGALRPGYSHVLQTISELTEAGAANKPWLDIGMQAVATLNVVFGIGLLWAVRRTNTAFRIAAVFMIFVGLLGLLSSSNPLDPIGARISSTGVIHQASVISASLTSTAVLLFAGFGWRALPKGNLWSAYCFASYAMVLFAALITIAANLQGWPSIGAWERLSAAPFVLWEVVVATALLSPKGWQVIGASSAGQ